MATLVVVAPGAARAGGFDLRHVDARDYPTIHAIARSPQPGAVPRVYENGARVKDATVENLGASKAIVVAVDRSKSMHGRPLEQAVDAATNFVHRKRPADQAAVLTFGSTALVQTSFSQGTIDADNALRTLSTDSTEGTALYDAIVLSAATLARQPLPGRVLVLLTDGHDVRSVATLIDALRAVRRANVVVDTIGLGAADSSALHRLAAASGGSFYSSPTGATLDAIYRRIAGEFDRTWRISYDTTLRPGQRLALSLSGKDGSGGNTVAVVVPGKAQATSGTRLPAALLRGYSGLLLVLLIVAALFYGAALALRRVPRVETFKRLVTAHTDVDSRRRHAGGPRETYRALVAGVDRHLRGLNRWGRIEVLVERAAVPVSAATLLVSGLVLGFAVALVVAVTSSSLVAALLVFLAVAAAPLVGIVFRARRRLRAFEEQLPDVLATVASALRAGHALKHALNGIAEDGAPPASVEFKRVLAETRLGRPLEEALVAMCERLGSEDLLYVASAVDVQTQVGGSLSSTFSTVAETVRQRHQHRRRVRALTASGRATATVLTLLPFALALLLTLVTPGYMLPFLRSGFGHMLILASIVSLSIGVLLLNRIVNVKA